MMNMTNTMYMKEDSLSGKIKTILKIIPTINLEEPWKENGRTEQLLNALEKINWKKDHEKNLSVSLLIYSLMSISKLKISYAIKKKFIQMIC